MEYWSIGEDPVSDWGRRDIQNCSARGQGKNIAFQNHNTFQRFLFFAFSILQHSNTPTKPVYKHPLRLNQRQPSGSGFVT
jgi:hypothetical protein